MLDDGIKLATPPSPTPALAMAAEAVSSVGGCTEGKKGRFALGAEAPPALECKSGGFAACRRWVAPLLLLSRLACCCARMDRCLWLVSGGSGIAEGDVEEEIGDVDQPKGPYVNQGCLAMGFVVFVLHLAGAHVLEFGYEDFAA